jgi:hypothetical protein
MKSPAAALAASLAITLCPALATAAETPDDRLILGANGSTLTGASGGGGAAVTWLHGLNSGALIGLGVQHQTIANARWSFASVTGSLTRGTESGARLGFYGEIHQGSGRIARNDFDYSILAVGASRTLVNGLTLHLESRQINIDTSHGNLPKLGVSYVWSPRLLTGLSYAHTVAGNLGTELLSARIDFYGAGVNLLAGGAAGQGSPAVFDLQTGAITQPGLTLKQVFIGFVKPHSRADFMMVVDYLDLADTRRLTLSLNCTVHLRAHGAPK